MADIRIETGVKEYNINGAVTVRYAPTDMAFIEKVCAALEKIDAQNDSYKEQLPGLADTAVFELTRRMDAEAREEINGIFGQDVCTPLFGEMNLYTHADGFPLWANLLLAIVDTFEGGLADEKKASSSRIAKYTAKYKKR